jgi:hypothetical protein
LYYVQEMIAISIFGLEPGRESRICDQYRMVGFGSCVPEARVWRFNESSVHVEEGARRTRHFEYEEFSSDIGPPS